MRRHRKSGHPVHRARIRGDDLQVGAVERGSGSPRPRDLRHSPPDADGCPPHSPQGGAAQGTPARPAGQRSSFRRHRRPTSRDGAQSPQPRAEGPPRGRGSRWCAAGADTDAVSYVSPRRKPSRRVLSPRSEGAPLRSLHGGSLSFPRGMGWVSIEAVIDRSSCRGPVGAQDGRRSLSRTLSTGGRAGEARRGLGRKSHTKPG